MVSVDQAVASVVKTDCYFLLMIRSRVDSSVKYFSKSIIYEIIL